MHSPPKNTSIKSVLNSESITPEKLCGQDPSKRNSNYSAVSPYSNKDILKLLGKRTSPAVLIKDYKYNPQK